MNIDVINMLKAEPSKTIEISDQLLNVEYNQPLIHQVVVAMMAGARAGTKAQKTKGEVRGGGAKPWRQKGTGRARAGSNRSPIWRKGGKVFAACPRDFSQKVNKKMYRGAMRSILSELLRSKRLDIVDQLVVETSKTKDAVKLFEGMGITSGLVIIHDLDINLFLAARNLPNIEIITTEEINPVSLVHAKKVLITEEALKHIEEKLV